MASPRGPYTAGARALPALRGQTFASYYGYQQARAQALGHAGYHAERTARVQARGFRSVQEFTNLRADSTYRTFVRRAVYEGRTERWARQAYLDRAQQLQRKLDRNDSRQLQIDEGLAEDMADTWYH